MFVHSNHVEDYFKAIREVCIKRENATKEDVELILNGTLPETRHEKCISACIAENLGVVSKLHFIFFFNQNLFKLMIP
jgi:hypothetical protein